MNLINRVSAHQNICNISLITSAEIIPGIGESVQPFSNTHIVSADFKPIYFGKSSVTFHQIGKDTRSGILFEQQLNITFPNGDLLGAERIKQYIAVMSILIKTSAGLELYMGRNDYFKNSNIKINVQNTQQMVSVSYKTKSIFPIGLTNGSADHLFGEEIPINFFNL